MMNNKNLIPFGLQSVMAVVLVVFFCGLEPAYCQGEGIALLLQKAPANGGVVNIGTGVHHFGSNAEVTLIATPRPGYQFAYWLGDVSEPTSSNTVVHMDVPKIIIAVFEKFKYDPAVFEDSAPTSNKASGGLMAHAADYSNRGFSGEVDGRRRKWRWPTFPPREPPFDDFPIPNNGDFPTPDGDGNFPSPNDSNDFPAPIPEPATGILLAIGSWAVLGRRRKKKV